MRDIWSSTPQGVFRARKWTGDLVGLVLPDIHIPAHDWKKLSLVLACARTLRLDFSIQLGDLLDFSALGKWAADSPGTVEGERMVDDFSHAHQFLDQWAQAVRTKNPDCALFVLEGNHEQRIQRLCDRIPYFRGIFHLPNVLAFDDLGISWVPSFSETKMLRFDWVGTTIRSRMLSRNDWTSGEGIGYIHGWYHNQHHAKAHAEKYGRAQPLIYGHTHDVQTYTSHAFGHPRPYTASLGHLRLADPEYIKGSERWQSAFALVYQSADAPGVWDIEIVRIAEDAKGNSHFWCQGRHWSTRGGVRG